MVFCYGSSSRLIHHIIEDKGGFIYNKIFLMLTNVMYTQNPKECSITTSFPSHVIQITQSPQPAETRVIILICSACPLTPFTEWSLSPRLWGSNLW